MNNLPMSTSQDKSPVPRELRSLAEEVKKYRTAEEFVARNVITVDPRELEPSEPLKGKAPSVMRRHNGVFRTYTEKPRPLISAKNRAQRRGNLAAIPVIRKRNNEGGRISGMD
jgi:hypothetical protein